MQSLHIFSNLLATVFSVSPHAVPAFLMCTKLGMEKPGLVVLQFSVPSAIRILLK